MACAADVKRSNRWLPSLDLMTNSTCLSICFCWISADTGSIILRPDRISSNTPSRKILSQLPGPPAAIPLITMDLRADSSDDFVETGCTHACCVTQAAAFSDEVAFPVTQSTKAGLYVVLLPKISVPVQSS